MSAAVLAPLPARADLRRIEVKPGESLAAARDKVRALPEGVRRQGVEIVLLPGDHVLPDTLLLDANDGGLSAESPVVWRGENGARVVGGFRVEASRFRPVEEQEVLRKIPAEARGKVVVADVSADIPGELGDFPDQFSGEYPPPLVFAGHAFATPARWPNEGYALFSRQVERGSQDAKRRNLYYGGAFVFDDQRAARWDFSAGVWLNGYWTHDWDNASVRAGRWGSEGGTNGVMRLAGGVPYGVMSGTWGPSERRFCAFNMIEELDAPGEWWIDRKRKLVYIVPPKGALSEADEIVLALSRRPLVKGGGALSHIAFENIAFEYSAGDGLRLSGSDIHVRNCRVSCCGGSGVVLHGDGNSVSGCEITQMGQSGVKVDGGDRRRLAPAGTSVDGNDIHGFGIVRRTYAPGIAVDGCGMSVRRNRIYDAPHSAVIYGGNEHLFESNEVYHVMLETGDAGAFYTGRDWTSAGNVLRYNFLHDLGPGSAGGQAGEEAAVSGESTMGFYFDDCDCGDAVYGNTFHRVARGIMIGGGREHPVSWNVFSCCNIGLSIDCRGMTWKQWNTPGGGWNLEEKAQKFDYTNGVWAAKYPWLAKIMQDHPREPLYNPVKGNVFVGCREVLRLDGVAPLERMAPIRDNVVMAAESAPPKIDQRIASGFMTVNAADGPACLEAARRLAAKILEADAKGGEPSPAGVRKAQEAGKPVPTMVAHRGAGDLAMPEASLPAYSNAVATACGIVKLDLRRTKDGVIVMGHDPTLKRNMGWDVEISSLDYAEILEKGRFLENGRPGQCRIVRLDEALAIARGVPELWLDFKNFSPEMAERVLAETEKAGIGRDRLMVATFSRGALAYFRDHCPEIRRVGHYDFDTAKLSGDAMRKDVLRFRDEYGLFGVNMPVGKRKTSPEDVSFLKANGLWVSLWFVQNAKEAAHYLPSGPNAFVTDHVSSVRQALPK